MPLPSSQRPVCYAGMLNGMFASTWIQKHIKYSSGIFHTSLTNILLPPSLENWKVMSQSVFTGSNYEIILPEPDRNVTVDGMPPVKSWRYCRFTAVCDPIEVIVRF